MRHLPRHAALLIILLCGAAQCFAQPGGAAPRAREESAAAWTEFSSAQGGFTVLMPGAPNSTAHPLDTPLGEIPQGRSMVLTDSAVYIVNYSDFPVSSEDPAVVKGALDAGRDNATAEQPGTKLLSEKEVVLDGHAGREWLFEGPDVVLLIRAYFIKGRLYQVMIGAPPGVAFKGGRPTADPGDRTEFFTRVSTIFLDSFRLSERREAPGEVDKYLAREKAYGKAQGSAAGGLFEAGLLEGRARSLPQPAYPPIARAARASGGVTVKVVVDEAGKVVAAQAVSGHPLLQSAAVKAAREAQFAPTLLEGKPVKVVGTISYNFVGN